jgi:hypothetical protein
MNSEPTTQTAQTRMRSVPSIGGLSTLGMRVLELGPAAVDSKLDPCDVGGVVGG